MFGNWIRENTATTGTGTMTLTSQSGFSRFSDNFGTGKLVYYHIYDGNNRESGVGTTGASNTLARTFVYTTLVAGTLTKSTTGAATPITLSGSATVYCDFAGTHTSNPRKGTDVASASTADIWANNDGDYVDITGTTTITSLGAAPHAGMIRVVRFTGALTLTHGALCTLPGSANITTAAGDLMKVVALDSSNNLVMSYQRASGNLVFNGTGQKILGDFSNATLGNRVYLQTSTANSSTAFGVLPSGSGTSSSCNVFGTSDPANAPVTSLINDGTNAMLRSTKTGTGVTGALIFDMAGTEAGRFNTSGNFLLGTTTDAGRITAFQATGGGGLTTFTFGNSGADATGNRARLRMAPTSGFTSSPTLAPYIEAGVEDAATNNSYIAFGTYKAGTNLYEVMRITSSGDMRVRSVHPATRILSGITTLTAADGVVICDMTGGAYSITLPAANAAGSGYSCNILIHKYNSATLTVNPAGSDLINGVNSGFANAITGQSQMMFVSDGNTGWYVKAY